MRGVLTGNGINGIKTQLRQVIISRVTGGVRLPHGVLRLP